MGVGPQGDDRRSMPEAARNLHHIKLGRNERRGVGVPQRVKRDLGQTEGPAGPTPIAGQVVRRQRRTIGLAKDQRLGLGLPEAQRGPAFELLAPMRTAGRPRRALEGISCAGRAGSWAV